MTQIITVAWSISMKALKIDEIAAKKVPWGFHKILVDLETVGSKNLIVKLTEMPPGMEHSTHQHKVEEVIIVLEGEGVHEDVGGEAQKIGANSVIYVPPNTLHSTRCTGSNALKMIVIFSSRE